MIANKVTNCADLLSILNATTANVVNAVSARDLLSMHVPNNIRVIAEVQDGDAKRGRFLLHTIHRGSLPLQLHHEANGIVLAFDCDAAVKWQCLVMPPRITNNIYDKRSLINNIKSYNITPMEDGTVVSLYHYDAHWNISTARGWRMNDKVWIDGLTYQNVVNEVLSALNITYDLLDVLRHHTICFHHPKMHPFTDGIRAEYLFDVPVELQPFINAPRKIMFPETFSNFNIVDQLTKRNQSALNNYIGNNTIIHYGYILRNGNTDICMESDLYREIKHIYYAAPRLIPATITCPSPKSSNMLVKQKVQHNARHIFAAMRAYMDFKHKYVAISLFPQFKALYALFDTFFNDLAANILLYIYDNSTFDHPCANLVSLVHSLIDHVRKNGSIDPTHHDSKSIIIDYLLDLDNVHIYVDHLRTLCEFDGF